jgi:Zn-dependent protease with chaperone function
MRARYADGRAAVFQDAECEIGAEALTLHVGEAPHVWTYEQLRRADDGNGRIVFKRKPDTGERLMFDADAEAALRAAAPRLFSARAQGVESPRVVGAVIAAAWSLAAVFLIGVPLAAEPLARATPDKYRNQIADISWSQVNAFTDYCDDADEATQILNDVAYRMMEISDVPQRDDIWITVADAPIPNAFALPDDSIVVTDDLIQMTEHPDELIGVIAHEIAHIEHNHVMTNIIRQMGAGIFFDVVFGGAGAGQAIAIASVNLASLRYSRGDEADADARGLDYLDAAGIDSGGLARLFERFEEHADEQGGGDIPAMLSSHPATAERAAAARARARRGLAPSLTDAQWRVVRQACGGSLRAPDAPPGDRAPPAPTPEAQGTKPEPLEGAAKPE